MSLAKMPTVSKLSWQQWGIKTRLVLIAILPVAYLFCAVVLYSYFARGQEAQDELSERARIVTKALADGIEHNILSGDLAGLKWTINGVVQADKNIYRIDILDARHNELVHVKSFDTNDTDGHIYEAPITRMTVPISVHLGTVEQGNGPSVMPQAPDTLGYVRVSMSPSSLLAKQAHRFYFELATSLLALGVSVWLALIWAASLIRPLRSAIAAVRQIRGGDYRVQIEQTTGGEIGDLQASIEQMAIALEQSKQELESKVQARTQELTISRNEALKADAEKRRLIQKVHAVVEEERNSIAIEIHDELNASLIAARLESQRILQLSASAAPSPMLDEIQSRARAIIQLTLALYNNGRILVRRLRPEVLELLGLPGAVEEMLRNYNQTDQACRFSFTTSGDCSQLGNALAISAYRIVQEAVSNIVKHASAQNARIDLTLNPNEKILEINIDDDGIGFDTDLLSAGIGITGMRERVFALQGSLVIQSIPGQGTHIKIALPA